MRTLQGIVITGLLGVALAAQDSRPTSKPTRGATPRAPATGKADPAKDAPAAPGEVERERAKKLFIEAMRAADPVNVAARQDRQVQTLEVLLKAQRNLNENHPAAALIREKLKAQHVKILSKVRGKKAPASPLVQGDYAKALQALDEARGEMTTATEIDAAFEALERAQKALMEARSALWKQKNAPKEADAGAPPQKRDG